MRDGGGYESADVHGDVLCRSLVGVVREAQLLHQTQLFLRITRGSDGYARGHLLLVVDVDCDSLAVQNALLQRLPLLEFCL